MSNGTWPEPGWYAKSMGAMARLEMEVSGVALAQAQAKVAEQAGIITRAATDAWAPGPAPSPVTRTPGLQTRRPDGHGATCGCRDCQVTAIFAIMAEPLGVLPAAVWAQAGERPPGTCETCWRGPVWDRGLCFYCARLESLVMRSLPHPEPPPVRTCRDCGARPGQAHMHGCLLMPLATVIELVPGRGCLSRHRQGFAIAVIAIWLLVILATHGAFG